MSLPKPFTCKFTGCDQSFANIDHLDVHVSNHELLLNFGYSGRNAKSEFLVDQTPTPTRLIKSCEDVTLFQDLQNVNPFEETFQNATKNNRFNTSTEMIDDGPNSQYQDCTLEIKNEKSPPTKSEPQAIYVNVIQKLPSSGSTEVNQKVEESGKKKCSPIANSKERREERLIRNRAAVHRSRIRKKKRHQALEAEFLKLFDVNNHLKEQIEGYASLLQKYQHLFNDEDRKHFDSLKNHSG